MSDEAEQAGQARQVPGEAPHAADAAGRSGEVRDGAREDGGTHGDGGVHGDGGTRGDGGVRGDAVAAAFRPVQPVRAYQRVAEQIEERILSGELPPGARLPAERELVRQFAVGRSTIREALRVLQSSGLVRSRPGDPLGAEVLGVSADNLSQALGRLTRSHLSSPGELVQFRMVLEAESNRLAARLRTEDDLRRMEAQIDRMAASGTDLHAFSEADALFHRAVADASGNALLGLCARAVHDAAVEIIEAKIAHGRPAPGPWRERSIAHHREVLGAIRAGDAGEAARLGRQALHDYYADHVGPEGRALLTAALET